MKHPQFSRNSLMILVFVAMSCLLPSWGSGGHPSLKQHQNVEVVTSKDSLQESIQQPLRNVWDGILNSILPPSGKYFFAFQGPSEENMGYWDKFQAWLDEIVTDPAIQQKLQISLLLLVICFFICIFAIKSMFSSLAICFLIWLVSYFFLGTSNAKDLVNLFLIFSLFFLLSLWYSRRKAKELCDASLGDDTDSKYYQKLNSIEIVKDAFQMPMLLSLLMLLVIALYFLVR